MPPEQTQSCIYKTGSHSSKDQHFLFSREYMYE